MAYQMAATAVTFNDLEGHSQVADLFKCNPSKTFMPYFTRFQLTVCSRGSSVLAEFLVYRETTDKRIVYARNTESG